jgi:hypothetical protein
MQLSVSLGINTQNQIELTEMVGALGCLRAEAIVEALFPLYTTVTLSLGHSIYSVSPPGDVGTLLEVLLACDRAMQGTQALSGSDAPMLRRVLDAWFAPQSAQLTSEDLRRLKAAVAEYYEKVGPTAVYQQVPNLLLGWELERAEEWRGAAQALQAAVAALPTDNPLRLVALNRLAKCRRAAGDREGAADAALEAHRVFGQRASTPDRGEMEPK